MTTKLVFNPVSGQFDLVTATVSIPADSTSTFTAGSVIFADGTNLAQDNSKFFWDDTNFRLGIGTAAPAQSLHVVGEAFVENIPASDVNAIGAVVTVTTNTTIDGSIETTGFAGDVTASVQTGATNDKAITGMSLDVTRGNTADDGTLSFLGGTLQFIEHASGTAGVTTEGAGFFSLFEMISGTMTDWYDFRALRVAIGGTLSNHYGIYIPGDTTTPVKNWLGDFTTIGGTSFSAPTVELDVNGDARVRNLSIGIVHADASGNLTSSAVDLATEVTGVLPEANGGTNQSTYTTGDTLYASASNTLSKLGIGSTGDVLTVAGGVPTWLPPSGGGGGGPANYVISSSCGIYSTASTSYVDVTNLTVTLTTSGNPVVLMLIADGDATTGNESVIQPDANAGNTVVQCVALLEGSTIIAQHKLGESDTGPSTTDILNPSSSVNHFYTPTAGTYTYKVQTKIQVGSSANMNYVKLVAYELMAPATPVSAYAVSSSSGTFATTSASYVDVTNLSVTINRSGRPVLLCLVPNGSVTAGQEAFIGTGANIISTSAFSNFAILSGSTIIGASQLDANPAVTGFTSASDNPPGCVNAIDTSVATGSTTYKVQAQSGSTNITSYVYYCSLLAYEI